MGAAKDYFEREESFFKGNIILAADEDYQFLSRSILRTRERNDRIIEMRIDLTDPFLRKWIRRATDIIKEKTGIVPGPQKLTATQRTQIYRVFYEDIISLVESSKKDRGYAYFRDIVSRRNHLHSEENSDGNYFQSLGYILDTKSAVCKELSAFGVILFSEYGLHTRFMETSSQMIEMARNMHWWQVFGHVWIGVQQEDGSLKFIDTNSRIFWSTNLRLLREHYPEISHLSDSELLSLSDEYTLMIPPALPE